MPDGSTFKAPAAYNDLPAPAPRIEDVYGVYGHSYDRHSPAPIAATFLFEDEAKRRPLGWTRGFVADGSLIEGPSFGVMRRVHLIPLPDCDVVLHAGEQPVRTTLRDFLANNDFEPEEQVAIQTRVSAGGLYVGGGGAAAEWSLHRADVPTNRFINADGAAFYGEAA